MKELYWLNVLGNVGAVAFIVSLLLAMGIILFFVVGPMLSDEYDLDYKGILKKMVGTIIVSLILAVFIPSKKRVVCDIRSR